MDPIVLVMSFCINSTPMQFYRCWNTPEAWREERITLSEEEATTTMQCSMQAQPTIAKFLEAHPNWVTRKWTCTQHSRLAEKT